MYYLFIFYYYIILIYNITWENNAVRNLYNIITYRLIRLVFPFNPIYNIIIYYNIIHPCILYYLIKRVFVLSNIVTLVICFDAIEIILIWYIIRFYYYWFSRWTWSPGQTTQIRTNANKLCATTYILITDYYNSYYCLLLLCF